MTMNRGTYQCADFLSKSGIDVFSGQYNQYVSDIIFMKFIDRSEGFEPDTVPEKFEKLGSVLIHVPSHDPTDFLTAMRQVVECDRSLDLNLKEIYLHKRQVMKQVLYNKGVK